MRLSLASAWPPLSSFCSSALPIFFKIWVFLPFIIKLEEFLYSGYKSVILIVNLLSQSGAHFSFS